MCHLRTYALGYLRGWGRLRSSLGIGISWRAYLNRLIPAPYYHCRRWRLILCAGTLDPPMHRCVSRTKVMEILFLTYPYVIERVAATLLRVDWLYFSG